MPLKQPWGGTTTETRSSVGLARAPVTADRASGALSFSSYDPDAVGEEEEHSDHS
jgi:hypothetical protein